MSICLHRIDQTHNMRRFYWLDVGEREGGAGAVGGLKWRIMGISPCRALTGMKSHGYL